MVLSDCQFLVYEIIKPLSESDFSLVNNIYNPK